VEAVGPRYVVLRIKALETMSAVMEKGVCKVMWSASSSREDKGRVGYVQGVCSQVKRLAMARDVARQKEKSVKQSVIVVLEDVVVILGMSRSWVWACVGVAMVVWCR
jgi:hypothetical protein